MKNFGRLCMALLVAGCAASGAIQTQGTQALSDTEVALVKVPSALSLLAVDGQQMDRAVGADDYTVRLLPGARRLRFAYEDDWGNPSTYDWIYSEHVVEVALQAQAGVTYTTGYPVPDDIGEARELARDLRVWIDDPTGGRAGSRRVSPHGSPVSRLLRGGGTYASEGAQTAAGDGGTVTGGSGSGVVVPSAGIIAGAAGAAAGDAPTAGDEAAAATASGQDPLQRLKIWWKLASEEDRRAFQAWVETQ